MSLALGFVCCAAVSILWWWSCPAEASRECFAKWNRNRTYSFFLSLNIPHCDAYNWMINGTVYANEENVSNTFVQSSGLRYCTFYSCSDNVTYRNTCTGVSTNCSGLCPTLSPLKDKSTPAFVGITAVIVLCILSVLSAERN